MEKENRIPYFYCTLVGMLMIGAGFYNLLSIVNFASLYPGAQEPGPTWVGVIAPLIIGVIILSITALARFHEPGPLNQKLSEIKSSGPLIY